MQLTNVILVGLVLLVTACTSVSAGRGGTKAPNGSHDEVRLERIERGRAG